MTEYRLLTQAELIAECQRRFGDDPTTWAFRCPNCGEVATVSDFPQGSDQLGQACVGRFKGALTMTQRAWEASGRRGCDWTAYGLLNGPWEIVMPDGRRVESFPLADPS